MLSCSPSITYCHDLLSAGYFVAIVACLWPAVVKSVVLINSAGNVIPEYSLLQFSNVCLEYLLHKYLFY